MRWRRVVILADTSLWVAHFRKPNRLLQSMLSTAQVLCHPLVVLELACGTPPAPRERTLGDLKTLKHTIIPTNEVALDLIERQRLQDLSCGAVDMSLLASVLLTPDGLLWTLDKNLQALAKRFDVAFNAEIQ